MHGIDLTTQMDIFYHAMNYALKGIIDASCYGDFKRRIAEEARQLIEDLTKCNYKAPSEASGSSNRLKGSGLIDLNCMISIEAVTPRFLVQPDWRIRTESRERYYISRALYLFFFLFFFRAELIPVGIQTIFVVTKNHLHIQRNYHRSGIHKNMYTYTKSHLLIQLLIHVHI